LAFGAQLLPFIGIPIALVPLFQSDSGVLLSERLKRGFDQITGADSFVYVVPQPHDRDGNVPLAIRSIGQNPLTGVKLTIRDISPGVPLSQGARIVDVGVVPQDTIIGLEGVYLIPLMQPGVRTFAIDITAINGIFHQTVQLRTSIVNGVLCFSHRLDVTKGRMFSEIGGKPPKTLVIHDWHQYVVACDKNK
jgi:hypothetical protein